MADEQVEAVETQQAVGAPQSEEAPSVEELVKAHVYTALTPPKAGIDTRFSTWATPKTSRNRSRSTARPRISSDSARIASACSRTSR